MGCYKRKEKRLNPWYYKFNYQGQGYGGSGYATAAECQEAEELHRKRLEAGSTGTFSSLVDRRLDYVRAYGSSRHYADTKAMLRRFADWAGLYADEITKEMVQAKLYELKKSGLTNNNLNRHLRALRTVLGIALEEELITRNPASGVPFFPVKRPVRYAPPRAEVLKAIMQSPDSLDRAYITVIWLTAARVGEIDALTWDDVDLEAAVVRLWTRKRRYGNMEHRVVPLIPQAYKALAYAWEHRYPGSPWVFTNPANVKKWPNEPNKWRYLRRPRLIKTITKLLDRPFTYHNLRHSTASTMVALGIELPVIQKVLGHQKVTTTDNYLHDLPHSVVGGMQRLGEELEHDGFDF